MPLTAIVLVEMKIRAWVLPVSVTSHCAHDTIVPIIMGDRLALSFAVHKKQH